MSHLNFERESELPVDADAALEWHLREGAFVRLMPPWAPVHPVEMPRRLTDGCLAKFDVPVGPLRRRWVARHVVNESEKWFQDIAESGPVSHWIHTHSFADLDDNPSGRSRLRDAIEFDLPLGMIGRIGGRRLIMSQLAAMFAYRHRVTIDDLAAHEEFREMPRQTIGITGATGLVGATLAAFLTTGGHRVIRLVRRAPQSDNEVQWNLEQGNAGREESDQALAQCDAVVHLAGENIAKGRWNRAKKERILDSRKDGTRQLATRLAQLSNGPKTLISASAIGFYGDRGDEILTEDSMHGDGFLASVCEAWESATRPAADAGLRVVHARLGVVMTAAGGALAEMLFPFKVGAGGPVGNGRQWWSWVAIDDVIGAIHHALMTESLRGPMNVVAPTPCRNREFAKVLGRVLRRPSFAPLPRIVARTVLGEMVDELLMPSAQVEPQTLVSHGYQFRFSALEPALRHVLGRASG